MRYGLVFRWYGRFDFRFWGTNRRFSRFEVWFLEVGWRFGNLRFHPMLFFTKTQPPWTKTYQLFLALKFEKFLFLFHFMRSTYSTEIAFTLFKRYTVSCTEIIIEQNCETEKFRVGTFFPISNQLCNGVRYVKCRILVNHQSNIM